MESAATQWVTKQYVLCIWPPILPAPSQKGLKAYFLKASFDPGFLTSQVKYSYLTLPLSGLKGECEGHKRAGPWGQGGFTNFNIRCMILYALNLYAESHCKLYLEFGTKLVSRIQPHLENSATLNKEHLSFSALQTILILQSFFQKVFTLQ